ncbi:unnamed protein product [Spirodela intermedia]|uniref:Uncharacterized protein n=1 Tax=Spirodela intermedia TaxID=51605 RepID=A0A7I8IIS5_SPIIN|nr:unnamed protein product [Spirodela intermedia]CAA6657756.1 unnamed protein product [Spirodela intermedia]
MGAAAESLLLPLRLLIFAIVASSPSRTTPPASLLLSSSRSSLSFSLSLSLSLWDSGSWRSLILKEGWDPEAVRVFKFANGSVQVGRSRRLEFQVRTGSRTLLVFTFPDELDGETWRKPRRRGRRGLALNQMICRAMQANVTRTGLKRVVLGGGIKIRVDGAEEVTLSYPSASGSSLYRSEVVLDHERKPSLFRTQSLCSPLISVSISGSVSLVAYKTHNDKAYIETASQSPDTLELLPDKCYYGSHRQDLSLSIISISSQMSLPERVLRMILDRRISQHATPRSVKVRIMPFTLVRFQVELERDIGEDDRIWSKAPKWKSRPTVERDWFEVLCRAEVGKELKPAFQRKLMMGRFVWDSVLWGSLQPNVSFTRLHSLVLPPEAFTLDV